jgi:hypothetical protein
MQKKCETEDPPGRQWLANASAHSWLKWLVKYTWSWLKWRANRHIPSLHVNCT